MSITFKNTGDVTTGAVVGHDYIMQSGLLAEDKQHMAETVAQLEAVLDELQATTSRDVNTDVQAEGVKITPLIKYLLNLSKDIAAKVLTALFLKYVGK